LKTPAAWPCTRNGVIRNVDIDSVSHRENSISTEVMDAVIRYGDLNRNQATQSALAVDGHLNAEAIAGE
jgi:hypothetical protein